MSLPEVISQLGPVELQHSFAACVRRYVALLEEGHELAPFGDVPVTATDVVATVSAMLEQVDVEVFELALWQSWGRV